MRDAVAYLDIFINNNGYLQYQSNTTTRLTDLLFDRESLWQFGVAVTNRTTIQGYRNGTPSTAYSLPLTYLDTPIYIGSRAGASRFFRGTIFDVRVWGRILSASEMADPDSLSETPLMAVDGYGVTDADWIDHGVEETHSGTVYGRPDPAFIRGEKVIINGEIKNP